MEKTIQWFHCTIVKMEISILYHVIVNSQLNRNNLTRYDIKRTIQRFHCTIVKMEISILCHVIENSQLNRDKLTRYDVIYNIVINNGNLHVRLTFNLGKTNKI